MSIRRRTRADGRFAYDVMLRRPDGTQYSRTFPTKNQARDWEAQERADRSRHRWVDPTAGERLFREYAEEWLHHRPHLRPRTVELYRSQLRHHLLPAFGDVAIRSITKTSVRAWHAEMLIKTSQVTAAKCYRLLAAMMNTAVDDELIGRSPCRIRGAAEEHSPERKLPTLAELFAISDAIDPRYRALILLAGLCGLRLGELQGLTRSDINLARRTVTVDKQAQEFADRIAVTRPKTDAGVRVVVIPSSIAADLETHLATWVGPDSGAASFTGPRGGLRRATFYTAWRQALITANVSTQLRPHDLRHLADTLAARVPGTTTKDLMARIGHASAQAALRYQHASVDGDRLISDGIDQLVAGARPHGGAPSAHPAGPIENSGRA